MSTVNCGRTGLILDHPQCRTVLFTPTTHNALLSHFHLHCVPSLVVQGHVTLCTSGMKALFELASMRCKLGAVVGLDKCKCLKDT